MFAKQLESLSGVGGRGVLDIALDHVGTSAQADLGKKHQKSRFFIIC